MNPHDLFQNVRSLWPDVILMTNDAHQKEDSAIWRVVDLYEAIERNVEHDPWLALGAWSFHQALTDVARTRINYGATTVHTSDVSFEAFGANMRSNLADESWAEERKLYGA